MFLFLLHASFVRWRAQVEEFLSSFNHQNMSSSSNRGPQYGMSRPFAMHDPLDSMHNIAAFEDFLSHHEQPHQQAGALSLLPLTHLTSGLLI
jgi:hypothetical protein